MRTVLIMASMATALSLSACTTTPTRTASVAARVATVTGGMAKFPALDDPYFDSAWFAEELSVDRAVQAALTNNPQTRVLLARLDGSQAERVQSGLVRNPVASLMVLRPSGGGRLGLDYGLMQSLFDLINRSRRVALADAVQARTEAEVLVQLAGMVQDTESAYYRALASRQRVRIATQQLMLEQRLLTLTERQARQGAISPSARLQQSAVVAMQEHTVREAKAAEIIALAALASKMGFDSATGVRLPDVPPDANLLGLSVEQAQQLAASSRAELELSRATIDAARAEQLLQTGALRTTDPAIGPAGKRESDGMKRNGLAFQVTLPIFDTGQARRDLAAANLNQALFLDEAQRRQIPLEVETALNVVATSQVARGLAEHHLAQQRRLATLAERTYGQGIGDLNGLIIAQQLVLAAELQRLDAQAALAEAIVGLHRATGTAMVSAEASR